jgi:hypothetical protein
MWQTYNTLALGVLMSFSELIVFFLFERMCTQCTHIDRRSKPVLLSREECTIVLVVVLLLFLLSFLCNQRSSCLANRTGDMIYIIISFFFLCLSLESLRRYIHSNFYGFLISNMFSSIIYHHHLIWTLLLLLKSE